MGRSAPLVGLALAAAVAGGASCLNGGPPNGAVRCGPADRPCPSGYYCAVDGTCWQNGSAPGDGGAADLGLPHDLAASDLPAASDLSVTVGDGGGALDLGAPATDLATKPADLATKPADLAGPPADMVLCGSATVTTFSGAAGTGGYVEGSASAARFVNPHGVAASYGALFPVFIADTGNERVRKADSAGATTFIAGSGALALTDGQGAAAAFYHPREIAADMNGNLYVADYDNNAIRKIDAQANVTTLVSTGLSGPKGITVAADGATVYFTDTGNHQLKKLAAGMVSVVAGTGVAGFKDGSSNVAQFDQPHGVWLEGGYLYVSDRINNRIRKVNAQTGDTTTLAGNGTAGLVDGAATSAEFNQPYGIVGDGAGTLYVGEASNGAVRRVASDGTTTTLAGAATTGFANGPGCAARFNEVAGLALVGANTLIATDVNNHVLRKIVF